MSKKLFEKDKQSLEERVKQIDIIEAIYKGQMYLDSIPSQ